MKLNEMANSSFVSDIKQILDQARQKAYSAINVAMIEAYWFVGKKIVEQEQQGQQRAGYGQSLIKELSKVLILDFGKGFSETNIRSFRLFYLTFPEYLSIQQTLSAKLGIVLCTETDQDIARYSILKGNEQIFATKYKLFLPTEEELRTEIEREKLVLKLQFDK